ncbi:MAG: hypothetical protein EB038_07670, partial [Cyclobacteriaceae bacterium]|nr:hypothetical protein [Cyclobacteriaceae bacterium]
ASSNEVGITAFHLSNIYVAGVRNGYQEAISPVLLTLTERFPREFFGWQAVATNPNKSPEEQSRAKNILRGLDPNFYCLDSNFKEHILESFSQLSGAQKLELLEWWGLKPKKLRVLPQKAFEYILTIPQVQIESKLESFCQQGGS